MKSRCYWLRGAVVLLLVLLTLPSTDVIGQRLDTLGRKVVIPTLDELVTLSPNICNGKVVELEDTHQRGEFGTIPIEFWKARIKILSNFKGKVPAEIILRFVQIDMHPPGGRGAFLVNQPDLVSLETGTRYRFFPFVPEFVSLKLGTRYRFFLKPVPSQQWYVVSVEGKFDECYSVQRMDDSEPDDNPPAFLKAAGNR